MAIKLQVRRDTAVNWTLNNPEVLPGEIGFETDTRRIKIGTIINNLWNDLPYIASIIDNHTHNTTDINFFEDNVQAVMMNFLSSQGDIAVEYDATNDELQLLFKDVITKSIEVQSTWPFQGVQYTVQTLENVSGSVILDISSHNVFHLTLSANTDISIVPTLTSYMTNIAVIIDNTIGSTITWNTSFKWNNGEVPVLTTGLHILSFLTIDSGTTWHNIGQVLNSH